jgi:putative chitinase
MITLNQLVEIARSPRELLAGFVDPLNETMARFDINTPAREAHFIAQAAHESMGFTRLTENLDYAVEALLRVWPKRFTLETAQMYGRIDHVQKSNQQMIANIAYAGRMGNGDVESGDGWRYRGRGIGGLTGLFAYRQLGLVVGIDLVEYPEQVALARLGCMSFGWFWSQNKLNMLADENKGDRISTIINGGDLGLDARAALVQRALTALGTQSTVIA